MACGKEEGEYTVGCALRKLMIHPLHVDAIEEAVHRVHHIVILGTELSNLLMRRWLEAREMTKLSKLFDSNFLCKIFNAVSSSNGREKTYDEMAEVYEVLERDMCLQDEVLPSRRGLTQCLGYEARSLAAVAKNNVWMHFVKRVGSHIRNHLDDEGVHVLKGASSASVRALRHQVTLDVCRTPGGEHRSPAHCHPWIESERRRLGISDELFVDSDLGELRPILYHLKKSPHLFLPAMDVMSRERERRSQHTFTLFPLRRSLAPRHAHFDEKCLRDLLQLGPNPHHAQTKAQKREDPHVELAEADVAPADSTTPALAPERRKRMRRSKDELFPEKASFFASLMDLRACQIRHRENFAFHLTTDGVCARVLMTRKKQGRVEGDASTSAAAEGGRDKRRRQFPTRGIWCIDALKEEARRSCTDVHVVGVDPGKRELVVAVDMDDTHEGERKSDRRGRTPVRYTQAQRAFETRCVEYDAEVAEREARSREAESALCGTNSRSASLDTFREYVRERRKVLRVCLPLNAHLNLRKRRWKASIKTQQSEARLFDRLRALRCDERCDRRPLVLAYGSWGLVAGRPGSACNRGNPPCIGVGLMRKLSKHFVVCPTPEAYTSKTCCKCLGTCGPCAEVDDQRVLEGKRRVRGLRRCQNEECMIFLNRDRNGATNIGNNFKRLFRGESPIRDLSDDEVQLSELRVLCTVA